MICSLPAVAEDTSHVTFHYCCYNADFSAGNPTRIKCCGITLLNNPVGDLLLIGISVGGLIAVNKYFKIK
jgi:hypothetical protein